MRGCCSSVAGRSCIARSPSSSSLVVACSASLSSSRCAASARQTAQNRGSSSVVLRLSGSPPPACVTEQPLDVARKRRRRRYGAVPADPAVAANRRCAAPVERACRWTPAPCRVRRSLARGSLWDRFLAAIGPVRRLHRTQTSGTGTSRALHVAAPDGLALDCSAANRSRRSGSVLRQVRRRYRLRRSDHAQLAASIAFSPRSTISAVSGAR